MKKGTLFQVSVYLLSLAMLAALYTFAIIPQVRKKAEDRYKRVITESVSNYLPVLIYQGDTPLLSGTIITEVNRDNFKIEKMPTYCLVNNAISDFDMINGKELKYTIISNQQLSFDILDTGIDDYDETKRLKEFNVISLVGEQAKRGTYIDVLVRYPDGSYEVLIHKIRIYDILKDENGYVKDSNGFYTILLAIDENEFMSINSALLTGYLDTRLYLAERVS